MESLTVEFLETDKDDNKKILINGQDLYKDSIYSEYTKTLFVYDENLFEELKKYQIRDILKYFKSVYAYGEIINKVGIDIKLNPAYYYFPSNEEKLRVSITLSYEPEDWNKPWSIKEHANVFFQKLSNYDNVEKVHEEIDEDEDTGEPIYSLLNGFGLALDIKDDSLTFESVYKEASKLCNLIDDMVEQEFRTLIEGEVVEKCIKFPPEYHQAGLGILNYFATYLREQYPEEKATVKIEQYDLTVRMLIETESGHLEVVEKALYEYELIVKGSEFPEKFVSNKELIYELNNELRIAKLRLESKQDLITMQNDKIDKLLTLVSDGLSKSHQVTIDFKPEINVSNNITTNQNVAASLGNISELLEKLPGSCNEANSLSELKESLEKIEMEDRPEIITKSSAMSKFRRLLNSAIKNGSELNKTIKSAESGWEILIELLANYNKVAQWCGLPIIPSSLLKKNT